MKQWILIFSLILVLGWDAPAIMAQVYEYTDDEGVVRYTDDAEQIPSHLRDAAKVQEEIVSSPGGIQKPAKDSEDKENKQDAALEEAADAEHSLKDKAPEKLVVERNELMATHTSLSVGKTGLVAAKASVPRLPRGKSRRRHSQLNKQIVELNSQIETYDQSRQDFNRRAGRYQIDPIPELAPIPSTPLTESDSEASD
jgi:hypothetical protein